MAEFHPPPFHPPLLLSSQLILLAAAESFVVKVCINHSFYLCSSWRRAHFHTAPVITANGHHYNPPPLSLLPEGDAPCNLKWRRGTLWLSPPRVLQGRWQISDNCLRRGVFDTFSYIGWGRKRRNTDRGHRRQRGNSLAEVPRGNWNTLKIF